MDGVAVEQPEQRLPRGVERERPGVTDAQLATERLPRSGANRCRRWFWQQGDDVAVGHDHALGSAGGAGGEDHVGGVVRRVSGVRRSASVTGAASVAAIAATVDGIVEHDRSAAPARRSPPPSVASAVAVTVSDRDRAASARISAMRSAGRSGSMGR